MHGDAWGWMVMDAYGRACSSHDSAETGAGAGVGFVFALGLQVLITLLFHLFVPFPLVVCATCAARRGVSPHDTQQEASTRAKFCADRDPAPQPAQSPGPHRRFCRAEHRWATYSLMPNA